MQCVQLHLQRRYELPRLDRTMFRCHNERSIHAADRGGAVRLGACRRQALSRKRMVTGISASPDGLRAVDDIVPPQQGDDS